MQEKDMQYSFYASITLKLLTSYITLYIWAIVLNVFFVATVFILNVFSIAFVTFAFKILFLRLR